MPNAKIVASELLAKAFFFASFLLTLIKRNEVAPQGRKLLILFVQRNNQPKAAEQVRRYRRSGKAA